MIPTLTKPETRTSHAVVCATSSRSAVRHQSLDVARGLAVLGMVYVHLIPSEGARTGQEQLATTLERLLEGKSAALFCVLAGMAWAMQAQRAATSPRFAHYIVRRACVLAGVGILFHLLVWPTEVLLPLALMLPTSLLLWRSGTKSVRSGLLLLLAAVPLLSTCFGNYALGDWDANGGYVADHALGWVSVRYLLFDGNYPLVPWLAFPLLGILMTRECLSSASRVRSALRIALPLSVLLQAYAIWSEAHSDQLAGYLLCTWVPTSLPFLLLTGSWAIAVIALLLRMESSRGLPSYAFPVASLGRASLTHYLAHICLLFPLLHRYYPNEDWSVRVGIEVFLLYFLLALPLTALWFRRFPRGPIESLWAWASGRY